jgi:hypothetical protein
VIDGVAKIIKTGADIYEGLIVGVLVVFAVTFTKSAASAQSTRRKFFSGALGWVTILNLTLLCGVMMALLGAKLLRGRVQMDAAWLAMVAATATACLLLIVRSSFSHGTKRSLGVAWAIVTIAASIGLDTSYPRLQRSSAMAIVSGLGGSVTQNDDGGIVVDLAHSQCDDNALKRLLPRLKFFSKIAELRLSQTSISDNSIDLIGRTFQDSKSIQALETAETKVTSGALTKLKRTLPNLNVRP